ncbi:TetR/AcrR family transcriptional regulator [Mycolicibacterium sp. S2-37]|uniref:TetR/AcrR family transcriptional regulator n=1 Tax=Mycolicibacterium sp. S2-37 TaxID=2810297 RepID=UPI001A93B90A|nr:TetR/AcrR family transcriptional regulator [Mycolicibacterium sp. S2-37]MBO0678073.1 TetR/AcrR family transcriptional regulator [Mycolicibacterium sp. S2-37]
MTTARRIGAPDAKNRTVLLDAAERLMLEEGYAAVTSRRVAEKAELKPQLVHYYFRTMDELYLAVFRRRADEGLETLERALKSAQPLWALWRYDADPGTATFSVEFAALASHRPELRAEVARYGERYREAERAALTEALERYGVDVGTVPPVVWAVFATSLSRVLIMEQALGMSTGHAETLAFIESWLRQLEGEPPPVGAGTASQWHLG